MLSFVLSSEKLTNTNCLTHKYETITAPAYRQIWSYVERFDIHVEWLTLIKMQDLVNLDQI